MFKKICKKFGFSKGESFWDFFISYIIFIIVCLISVTIIYLYSIDIIKTEIHTTSYALIGQAKQTIDVRQKEINNLAFAISRNPRVMNFSNASSELADFDRYNSIQVINDLQTYNISNGFISDCYVYFKDSDLIINSQSRYTPRFFYDNIYKLKNISYEDWYVSLLNNYNENNFLPATPVNTNGNGDGMVMFIQTIPYQGKNEWYMNFVVMIKEDNIKKVLGNISDENSGNSYIITPDNKVITSITANNGFKYIKYDELNGNEGFFVKKINNVNMMITYTTSSYSKWKYVSAVPINIYLYKLDKLRDITLVCSIIFLIIGLIAAILFAYRDFAPIKVLFDSITSQSKNTETVNELEQSYTSIQEVVKKVINENNILKSQRPILQMSLFASLIRGELSDVVEIDKCIKLLDIHFISPMFGIILLLVEDITPEMSLNIVSSEIDKTLKDIIKPEYGCYTILLENRQVVVLCNFEAENFSDGEAKMLNLTEAICKNVKQSINISITSAISGICCEPQNISKCYKEALIAMDYRLIKGKNSIIRYNEDLKLSTSQHYYHPADTENYIINLVSLGDIAQVNSILDEIYHKNFIEGKLSTFVVRCLMYDMINTTIRCLHEITFEGKEPFGNSIDPIEQLSTCETMEELYEKIKSILATLCKAVESNKKSHNTVLKDEIVEYINNNYVDHNICLDMIAEKFDLAPAYISRFFKEQTGIGFSDYLNKVRVDKATELMKDNQNLSIVSIAKNVGYSNANTLIRCFKKYKGITPGKYKDNQEIQYE